MSGGGKVTIGYKYYIGMHLVMCYGPVDEVQEIRFDDRTAWTGPITSSQEITISAEGLFGGESREGGVAGAVDVAFGEDTQTQNSYLQSQLGTNDIPAFRNVLAFIFKSFYFGMNPYIKNPKFLVKRIPSNIDPTSEDINGDANPAHMLYEILTNADWGMGYSTGAMNTTSFIAAGQTLYNEGFGLSLAWSQQATIEDFVQIILDHINGAIYVDLTTGQFNLNLIRDDYVVGNLPVFDETNIVDFESFERRSWGETVNELTVVYHDRDQDEDIPVTVQAMGNIAVQNGEVISQTRQYTGISNADLALRVAQRDLNTLSAPLSKIRIKVNRDAYNLPVGSPFVVTWPKYGIEQVVFRLAKVNMGSLTDGHMVLEAMEDVFGLPDASFTSPQDSGWVSPLNPPETPTYRRLEEAGYIDLIQVFGETYTPTIPEDTGYLKAIAAKPTTDAINFGIIDKLTADTVWAEDGSGDFSPFGTLVADMVQESVSTFDYQNNIDADQIEVGDYIQIEGEKMEVVTHNVTAKQIVVNRGILDTVPTTHTAGAPIFASQYFNGYAESEFVTGEQVDLKILTRTGLGELAEGDATLDQHTMDARKDKPYPPGNFRAEGEVPFTTEMMTPGHLDFTWSHRDRLQQTLLTGFVTQTDGDVGPEDGTRYQLDLYGDGTFKESFGTDGTAVEWSGEASGYTGSAIDPTRVDAGMSLTNGDRYVDPDISGRGSAVSLQSHTSGRYYFELGVYFVGSTLSCSIGLCTADFDYNDELGADVGGDSWAYRADGRYRTANGDISTGNPTYTSNNTVMCAIDFDTGEAWFGKDGTWNGSGDPETGANPSITGLPAEALFAAMTADHSGTVLMINLEARHLTFAPPAGFMAFSDGGDVQLDQWASNEFRSDLNCYPVGDTGLDLKRATTNAAGSSRGSIQANHPPGHTKWYIEYLIEEQGSSPNTCIVGACENSQSAINHQTGLNSGNSVGYSAGGTWYTEGSSDIGHETYDDGDLIMIAFDDSNGKVWYGKNGVWLENGDPALGLNESVTQTITEGRRPCVTPGNTTGVVRMLMHPGEMVYGPPDGFEAAGSPRLQHRYWRLFAETNHGSANYIGLANIEFISPVSSVGGVDKTDPTIGVKELYSFSTSALSASYTADRAFDGSNTTLWLTSNGNITNEACGWDFVATGPIKINEFSMKAYNSSYYDMMPKDFRLEYSDDGVNYHTRYRKIDDPAWTTIYEERNYVVDNDAFIERHSVIRGVLRSVRDGRQSFTEQDYTFRRADYGYSYGMFYGGL